MRTRASPESEARTSQQVRRLNLHRMLTAAMEKTEPFTRAEIVQVTGLSVPTVGTLSEALLKAGLLRDAGVGPSRGGRRPSFLEFDSRCAFVVGVALGATHTHVAVSDLRGDRLGHRMMATPLVGPRRLLGRIAGAVRDVVREAGVPREKVLAAAIGVPGAVDREQGTVVALTPNLKGWVNVAVAKELGRSLPTTWIVENDVNLAVLGERWRGAAQGHDTCAFIHAGTGIGAGIVVDGHLHRGHQFQAGEIGLMCMGKQYLPMDFGSRGCLESLAGAATLQSRWSTSKDHGRHGLTEILAAAEVGQARARRLVGEAAVLIGIAAAHLALVLDPSLIVVGGALAHGSPFLDEVKRVVGHIIPKPPGVVASQLGREAALWGALAVAVTEARAHLRDRLGARPPTS